LHKVVISLEIEFIQLDDNTYSGYAQWLEEPVIGDTFEDVYYRILKLRPRASS